MRRIDLYKLFLFLVALLFLSAPTNGQRKDNCLIYTSLKGNAGNHMGGGITLDLIRNNKYSIGMGYYEHVKKPGNLPPDYERGIFSLLTFGEGKAQDNLQSVSFTFGRVFLSKSNSKVRYHVKAGLTYSVLKKTTNWVKLDEGLSLWENYSYNYEKFHEPGILINPTIDFPVFKFLGFSAGPYLFINPQTTSYGMELSYMVGYVRK